MMSDGNPFDLRSTRRFLIFASLLMFGCGGQVASEPSGSSSDSTENSLPPTQSVASVTDPSLNPELFKTIVQSLPNAVSAAIVRVDQQLKNPEANRRDLLTNVSLAYMEAARVLSEKNLPQEATRTAIQAWELAKASSRAPGEWTRPMEAMAADHAVFTVYFKLVMEHGSDEAQREAIKAGLSRSKVDSLGYMSRPFGEKMKDAAFASMVAELQIEADNEKYQAAADAIAKNSSFKIEFPTQTVHGDAFPIDRLEGKPAVVLLLRDGGYNAGIGLQLIELREEFGESANFFVVHVVTEAERDPVDGLFIMDRAFDILLADAKFLEAFPESPVLPTLMLVDKTGEVRLVYKPGMTINPLDAVRVLINE